MILYISRATSYKIYNRLFTKGVLVGGYQAQKFNYNIITGLAKYCELISLASLPYGEISCSAIEESAEKVSYYCVKNKKGKLHKFNNIVELIRQGKKLIKKYNIQYIICDAIALAPAFAALKLGKKYHIPVIGIITDIPETMHSGKLSFWGKLNAKIMKKYDAYVLLTEAMNGIVNPMNKPYVVMEGACGDLPEIRKKQEKRIIVYSGSLWANDAGLEYFTEGFIKANLPNTELHFYGTGAFVEVLKCIEQQYPQIQYKGCITNEEMVKRQTEATLLINPRPSNQEFCKYSFPSKTFEYMASGTPVLMTRLPGIPSEYYDYVYTIEEETSGYVAKKLQELFTLPKEELEAKGLAAREFVVKNKNNIIQAEKIIRFLTKSFEGQK